MDGDVGEGGFLGLCCGEETESDGGEATPPASAGFLLCIYLLILPLSPPPFVGLSGLATLLLAIRQVRFSGFKERKGK